MSDDMTRFEFVVATVLCCRFLRARQQSDAATVCGIKSGSDNLPEAVFEDDFVCSRRIYTPLFTEVCLESNTGFPCPQ